MRHIDVEKKRKARWPWLLGLVVLGGVLVGVTILLRPPEEPEPPVVGTTADDTLPPASIPAPAAGGFGGEDRLRLADLAPIEEEDMGTVLLIQGPVLATGNDSFWMLSDTLVIRIESQQRARQGDTVAVSGALQPADSALTARIASQVLSRHPDFERWTVLPSVKLVEEQDVSDGGSVNEGSGAVSDAR